MSFLHMQKVWTVVMVSVFYGKCLYADVFNAVSVIYTLTKCVSVLMASLFNSKCLYGECLYAEWHNCEFLYGVCL
jgi:hypothetical protein